MKFSASNLVSAYDHAMATARTKFNTSLGGGLDEVVPQGEQSKMQRNKARTANPCCPADISTNTQERSDVHNSEQNFTRKADLLCYEDEEAEQGGELVVIVASLRSKNVVEPPPFVDPNTTGDLISFLHM